MELAGKKGRTSSIQFEVGDRVVIQDNMSKRWTIKGQVSSKRVAEDGSNRSFMIMTDGGKEMLRNAKFMKHEWKIPKKKAVSFDIPMSEGSGMNKESEGCQSVALRD